MKDAIPCSPDSYQLLKTVEALVNRLARDGVALDSVIIDIDEHGELVALSRSDKAAKLRVKKIPVEDVDRLRLPEAVRPRIPCDDAPKPMSFTLRHGIELVGADWPGIDAVSAFLAKALQHFKHLRDVRKMGAYARNVYWEPRRRGWLELSRAANDHLSVAAWTAAVLEAYTTAEAVQDLIANLPALIQDGAAVDTGVRPVLDLLMAPDGDFLALDSMLKQLMTTGRLFPA